MEPKTITLPKTTSFVMEYSLLAASFFIPFIISGPQLLTGTIVNALLYLFVLRNASKTTLPMVVLPSIGALLNGILFGKFTVFLLYFLPIIWISNYVLIQSFSFLSKKKYPPLVSIIGSSVCKSLILFSVAFFYTSTKMVPMAFLQLMGLFQLATALIGGIGALGMNIIISKKI